MSETRTRQREEDAFGNPGPQNGIGWVEEIPAGVSLHDKCNDCDQLPPWTDVKNKHLCRDSLTFEPLPTRVIQGDDPNEPPLRLEHVGPVHVIKHPNPLSNTRQCYNTTTLDQIREFSGQKRDPMNRQPFRHEPVSKFGEGPPETVQQARNMISTRGEYGVRPTLDDDDESYYETMLRTSVPWMAQSNILHASFSPDDAMIAVLERNAFTVLKFRPSGSVARRFVLTSSDGYVFDAKTGVSFSRDSSKLMVYGTGLDPEVTSVRTLEMNQIRVYDVASIFRLSRQTIPQDMVGRPLIRSSETMRLIDRYDQRWRDNLPRHVWRHTGRVNDASFSEDGLKVVSASGDRTACIWNIITGARIHVLEHVSSLSSSQFNPDATLVVTSERVLRVNVWDALTGDRLRTLIHQEDPESITPLKGASFGHRIPGSGLNNGDTIISIGQKKVIAWRHESGDILFEVSDPTTNHREIKHASFERDGHITLVYQDGTIASGQARGIRVRVRVRGISSLTRIHELLTRRRLRTDQESGTDVGFEFYESELARDTTPLFALNPYGEIDYVRIKRESNRNIVYTSVEDSYILPAEISPGRILSFSSDENRFISIDGSDGRTIYMYAWRPGFFNGTSSESDEYDDGEEGGQGGVEMAQGAFKIVLT